ncbi:MAG TPA: class I lanthipeptide [Thermoanaerobaculia bacterium]|nr:class I lanthipeptide [Thermoanaerobaculia bacterium]
MKKKLRKLSLTRETLRHLQARDLGRAAGGTGCTQELQTTCICTEANCESGGSYACPTQGQSCGCPPGCQSDTFEILSGCASNCG